MKKFIIFIGILHFCFQSLAMHSEKIVREYKGQPITPANIESLIGKPPTDMLGAINDFLDQNSKNPLCNKREVIERIIEPADLKSLDTDIKNEDELYNLVIETIKQKTKENSDLFALLNVENMTSSNYVFHCPTDRNWIIKIASAGNRLINLLTSAGINVYTKKPMGDREINCDVIKNTKTYQTISVAQIALMLKDLIKNKPLEDIAVPKTYLYHLPDSIHRSYYYSRNNPSAEDLNSFVAQEFVPGLVHFHDHPNLLNDPTLVTPKMTYDLKLAIAHAALWNLRYNLAICLDGNSPYYRKLVIFDTEQRNLTSPEEFTTVEADLYNRIGGVGLTEVKKLFASRPDLLEALN